MQLQELLGSKLTARQPVLWTRTEAFRDRVRELDRFQGEVAREAKVTAPDLSHWINNKRPCSPEVARRLCDVLGVADMEALFYLDPARQAQYGPARAKTPPVDETPQEKTPTEESVSSKTLKAVGTPWTDQEDHYLLDHWNKTKHRDIAVQLGRTQAACEQRRYALIQQQRRLLEARAAAKQQMEAAAAGSGPAAAVPPPAPMWPPVTLDPAHTPTPTPVVAVKEKEEVPVVETVSKQVNGSGPESPSTRSLIDTLEDSTDPVERELSAMLAVHRIMTGLPADQRQHVITWAVDRYVTK